MNSNDQYASYNQRINGICNELSIIGNRVSSLEERTELRLSDITADSGPYAAFEAQQSAYRKYFDSLEAESMGCQGDTLGQCEHGCDGISDRGSCIDDRVNNAINRFKKGMGDYPGKHTDSTPVYGTVEHRDGIACGADLRTAQCGRPAYLCVECSPAMHEAMSMPAAKQGERACKYELSDADSCDYSNKPRRARVDNDDGKYGSGLVDGLEGILGRCDSEQKANMSEWAIDIPDCGVIGGYRLRAVPLIRWTIGADWAGGDSYSVAVKGERLPVAPAQVVYCCNGAMYEAR